MANPEIPQSEEFAREAQFRIELSDSEALYRALDHSDQMEQMKPTLEIGSLHAERGLFSEIIVQANIVQDAYLLRGGYSITARLKYRNQADQYWPKEQRGHLLKSLSHDYPDTNIGFKTNNPTHSVVAIGPISKLLYVIDLGYDENEKTVWKYQLERDYNALSSEKALRQFMTARYPAPVDSHVAVRPVDTDSNIPENFFTIPTIDRLISNTQAVKEFTETTKKWAWHVQDFVNAIAKFKGIPQSGTLTLLPPEDLPQL